MDDKTAELRDIFVDVAGEETVTERQETARGSIQRDEAAVEEELEAMIAEMHDRFEFVTDLSTDQYGTVVRGYYEGTTDAALAERIGVSRGTLVRARLDLHLLRDRDFEAPLDLDALRDRLERGISTAEAAEAFDVSPSTVRRYRRVLTAQRRLRSVNGQYTREFAELLTDADLEEHTDESTYDGLREAAADIETDVAF